MKKLMAGLALSTIAIWLCLPAGAQPRPAASDAPASRPTTGPASQPTTQPTVTTIVEEWYKVLEKGGKTMLFLGLLSVTGLTYTLERLFRLRRGVIVPKGLSAEADELWKKGNYDGIIALARKHPSTLGRILEFIVQHRDSPVPDISTTAGDIAAVELRYHTRRTYPLAVVATLSPLLGLLGTVFGMIESFDVVAIAGALGDASQLAGGISKALITTAAGLVIAVPALALFHYFRERTNLFGDMLEKEVTDLVIEWMMKGGKEGARED